MTSLLETERLDCRLKLERGDLYPVQGVSLSIGRGEAVALVGESGCGKSLTALAVMGLLPPPAKVTGGRILFNGEDLLDPGTLRRVRGESVAMIFQEPMTSLNPVLTVGFQVAEVLTTHRKMDRRTARDAATDLLERVGIADAKARFDAYPHQFSGGMRQRVMIAMAVACAPALLIADEPTTALDVTIQAQILDLIQSLQQESSMGLLLITHDLGIVAQRTQKTCIMYTGMIVEEGPTTSVVTSPLHPYTRGLLDSHPRRTPPGTPLPVIPGTVDPPRAPHTLCPFLERCSRRFGRCGEDLPPHFTVAPGRTVRCWLYGS